MKNHFPASSFPFRFPQQWPSTVSQKSQPQPQPNSRQAQKNQKANELFEQLNQATATFLSSISQIYQLHGIDPPPFEFQGLKRMILAGISPVRLTPNYDFFTSNMENNNDQPSFASKPIPFLAQSSSLRPNVQQDRKDVGQEYQQVFQDDSEQSIEEFSNYQIDQQWRQPRHENSSYLASKKQQNVNKGYNKSKQLKERGKPQTQFDEQIQLGKLIVAKTEQRWQVKKNQIQALAKILSKYQLSPNNWAANYLAKNQSINKLIQKELPSVCASLLPGSNVNSVKQVYEESDQ